MGRRFLITGTDVGVGKTTVGCALGFAMRARGMRVGVMKPIDTGCAEVDGMLVSKDAQALRLAAGSSLRTELVCPYLYSSAVASADADLEIIARCFHEIAADSDAILVESAGTIATPINDDNDFADLASMLGLEVLVVVGSWPGCVDQGALALNFAESRGLITAGYILCDVEPGASRAEDANERALMRLAIAPYLGRMRHREPLAKSIVERLL
jgi:dethiobiotin synthetase